MKLRLWGTRGSLPTPGLGTERYGGNTACIEVRGDDPTQVIVLDAGSGIRLLGMALPRSVLRVHLLLSHLHMDHILGLGFFSPLFRREMEVHIWGPSSATLGLGDRLARYLSPPLFPVRLNELACQLVLHDVPLGTFELPGVQVTAALVCHPGPTVGYRIDDGRSVLAYLPDHEPALGARPYPGAPGGPQATTSRPTPTCSSTTRSTTTVNIPITSDGATARSPTPSCSASRQALATWSPSITILPTTTTISMRRTRPLNSVTPPSR